VVIAIRKVLLVHVLSLLLILLEEQLLADQLCNKKVCQFNGFSREKYLYGGATIEMVIK
jgi:hypothetical protein